MTLVDEDINSMLTNDANRTTQDNVAMQVTKPGDQVYNFCKWPDDQYWKFGTNANTVERKIQAEVCHLH